ncbi:MAG: retron St85 family effector protein [Candidatus Humimicrobiaceae bacterium]
MESEIILNEIYSRIYLKEYDFVINIFLCGENLSSKNSIRKVIYETINTDSRYNVVFPEWIFSNLIITRNYNLLNLENDLADHVDAIVIPLSIKGYGTYAELGAFSSNTKLLNKIIVLNNDKFKHANSFINLGPIALIKNLNNENLIYFKVNDNGEFGSDSEKEDFQKKVIKRIKQLKKIGIKIDLKNIFNLTRFILHIIAIYQPIKKSKIIELLDEFNQINLNKIPTHYTDSCIEILLSRKIVNRDLEDCSGTIEEFFNLTENGHKYIYENLLIRLRVVKKFCTLRAKILYKNYRKKNIIDMSEKCLKFLEI